MRKNVILKKSLNIKKIMEDQQYPSSQTLAQTPPSVPTPPPLSTSPQPAKKFFDKTSIMAIVGIILSLFLIGGGVFGAPYLFPPKPETIIRKMMERISEIQSYEYDGEIKLELFTKDGSQNSILINLSGETDISNVNNVKNNLLLNVNAELSLFAPSKFDISLGMQLLTIGDTVYAKINNMPDKLGMFDLTSINKNQWIKIELNALRESLKEFEIRTKTPFSTELNAEKEHSLSAERQRKQKIQIISQASIFKIEKELPAEKINGVKTRHYQFILDKEGVKKMVAEITGIIQNRTLTAEEQKELKDFNDFLDNHITSSTGEIWISKKDFLPYKLTFDAIIKDPNEKLSDNLALKMNWRNFNQPVQMETPKGAKSLKTLIEEIQKESLNKQYGAEVRDIGRMTYLREIQNILKIYYAKFNFYPVPAGPNWDDLIIKIKMGSIDITNLHDPLKNKAGNYFYEVSPDKQTYVLGAVLEDPNHPELQTDIDIASFKTRFGCVDPIYCIEVNGVKIKSNIEPNAAVIAQSISSINPNYKFRLKEFPNVQFQINKITKAQGGVPIRGLRAPCNYTEQDLPIFIFTSHSQEPMCLETFKLTEGVRSALVIVDLDITNDSTINLNGRFLQLMYDVKRDGQSTQDAAAIINQTILYGASAFSGKGKRVYFVIPENLNIVTLLYGNYGSTLIPTKGEELLSKTENGLIINFSDNTFLPIQG